MIRSALFVLLAAVAGCGKPRTVPAVVGVERKIETAKPSLAPLVTMRCDDAAPMLEAAFIPTPIGYRIVGDRR